MRLNCSLNFMLSWVELEKSFITLGTGMDTIINQALSLKTKLQEAKTWVNFTNLMIFG